MIESAEAASRVDHCAVSRRQLLTAAAAALVPAAATPLDRRVMGHVERLDPALDPLIDIRSPVEEVMTDFTWSEGPLWVGGRDGMLLVSDPQANLIKAFREKIGTSIWLRPSGYAGPDLAKFREPGSNGLSLGRGGILVADSGNRRISRIDLATKTTSSIVDRFEGKRFNSPNDLCVSPKNGSIYFTDPPYGLAGVMKSPDREMDYTGVFQLNRQGAISLIGKYDMPNGVAISPDGSTLYHTDRKLGWVAHALDDNGDSSSERTFIDLAAEGVTASGDGMKIDSAGNLWASNSDGLSIFSPKGKRLGIIRADDRVSNCEIGWDGYLYITSDHRVCRLKVKARKISTTKWH